MVGFIPENYILMIDENEVMVDAPDFTEQQFTEQSAGRAFTFTMLQGLC